jgi:hypothetical protein
MTELPRTPWFGFTWKDRLKDLKWFGILLLTLSIIEWLVWLL